MTMQTPLGRIRGLGSAKEGAGHWWAQRVTAVALVPLAVWFTASLVMLTGAGHLAVSEWLASPVVAVLMLAFLGTALYHLALGCQVVIEDYVHSTALKTGMLLCVQFGCVLIGLASSLAVLRLAVGG